jgi:hypothetical protein
MGGGVTTARGCDYAWDRPPIPALQAAGCAFAGRYLSNDSTKNLDPAETRALLAAGISIVTVWESTAQAMLRGYPGGVSDAQEADRQARVCGMADAVIYFAADWDATVSQQPQINSYLDGAASVIGRGWTGMYGGFWPIVRARGAGKASWWWGTVAWSGSNWDNCGWRPHIMQAAPPCTIGGVSCDWDIANFADFGQWPRPALEEDDMIIVRVDPASVPAGTPQPGYFLLFSNGTLGHITPASATVNNVTQYEAAGVKGPVTITYQEYLARGGTSP